MIDPKIKLLYYFMLLNKPMTFEEFSNMSEVMKKITKKVDKDEIDKLLIKKFRGNF